MTGEASKSPAWCQRGRGGACKQRQAAADLMGPSGAEISGMGVCGGGGTPAFSMVGSAGELKEIGHHVYSPLILSSVSQALLEKKRDQLSSHSLRANLLRKAIFLFAYPGFKPSVGPRSSCPLLM